MKARQQQTKRSIFPHRTIAFNYLSSPLQHFEVARGLIKDVQWIQYAQLSLVATAASFPSLINDYPARDHHTLRTRSRKSTRRRPQTRTFSSHCHPRSDTKSFAFFWPPRTPRVGFTPQSLNVPAASTKTAHPSCTARTSSN